MELHLFVLQLFTGVHPLILPVLHEYYLVKEGKTWNDAQAYCQANYTDLATINSNSDMVQLQNEAKSKKFSSSAWVGLYTNINSWYWSLGNETLGNFTSWGPSQPDNAYANEQCVYTSQGQWNDLPCGSLYYFACYDATQNGNKRYILIYSRQSWLGAQSYCRQHYTDLASARDTTENVLIGGLNTGTAYWIGLTRNPWKWSDQTTDVSFITWSPGNATDYSMNKSCGYLSNSKADVAQCSDIMPFYCYVYPTEQQIMRVKVKSSQDVNDPAVKAAILEKIQQKLWDHAMSVNTTVIWRKQSDGVVFHKEKDTCTAL